MAQAAPLLERLVVYAIGALWATVSIFTSIIQMFRKGPVKFFTTKNRDTRPACLDDPALGVHSFIKLKSIRLHYVASGPEGKPLMLFIHGFPEFWYSWRHQIKEFNKDYRCVAVDLRGYGETDKPQGIHEYVVDNMADDIKELIEGLGYSKCTLVAHDWGGVVAMQFAHLNEHMVQRLVLCNIGHPKAFNKLFKTNITQFLMSWYVFLFQMPYLPEMIVRSYDYGLFKAMFAKKAEGSSREPAGPDDIEAYKWCLSRPGCLSSAINYYRAAVRYRAKPLPKTPLASPTLMVWGTQDTALSKRLVPESSKYFSDYTAKYIETSGHWVQMEAPEETNTHIREFLAQKKRE